jgi:hypothetical protein
MAITNAKVTFPGSAVFTAGGTLPNDFQEYAITCMIFCNDSAVDADVTIYVVPQGETVQPSSSGVTSKHKIVNALPVPPGETVTFDSEKLILGTGDRIVVESSSNDKVVVTLSSLRIV